MSTRLPWKLLVWIGALLILVGITELTALAPVGFVILLVGFAMALRDDVKHPHDQ
jgi:hypothetical protein